MGQLDQVEQELDELRKNKTLLGWMPILNPTVGNSDQVRAVIEVKISPEREGGFDRMALRISKFEEVESCYLMSGGYDLLVFVTGKNLKSVAFLFLNVWPLFKVFFPRLLIFLLRPYKDHGHILTEEVENQEKPSVSP